MHLSFSLYGSDDAEGRGKQPEVQWHVLNVFLQSIGVVLSDFQDVIFKYLSMSIPLINLQFIYFKRLFIYFVIFGLLLVIGKPRSNSY